jgi:outer membrane protein OmpA-like peptidoglycan-associated protein
MMKRSTALLLVQFAVLTLLAGCASPPSRQPGLSAPPPGAAAGVRPPAVKEAAPPTGGQAALQMPPLLASQRINTPQLPEPDAVIKLEPGSGNISSGMDNRLEKIADAAKADDRIIVRLESYVREGGSTALSIGIGDRLLQKVRDRLQSLGVASRRILLANFGEEYRQARDPSRHWVEIYLLKPGY